MGIFDLFSGGSIDKGVEEFHQTAGAVLVDVRTSDEYRRGHIPESVNLPLDRIDKISYTRETPLFVYCQSGARSGRACSWLKQQGYDATNIGGIAGYRGPLA